jgi:hypothetical protein
MGAQDFTSTAKGKTAQEAFNNATEQARYEYGHGGYSGTIAEKHEFVMYVPKPGQTPGEMVDAFEKDWSGPYADKWGPAGCIDLGDGEFLFFGSASC